MSWDDEPPRRWTSIGKTVCSKCFSEPDIAALISRSASEFACSYCETSSATAIAVNLDALLPVLVEGILFEWGDPAEYLPYSSADGGYQGATVYDGAELVYDVIDIAVDDAVREDIATALAGESYCDRHWIGDSDHGILVDAWEHFVEVVKHRRRFFYDAIPAVPDGLVPWRRSTPVSQILTDIAETATRLGLVHTFSDLRFIRARLHAAGEAPRTAKELGSPPDQFATMANRMSAAGISMFYGAENHGTAERELHLGPGDAGKMITFATFRLSGPAVFLDLFNLPIVPSLFTESREMRGSVSFIREFAKRVVEPITRDDRAHINYVPTQIVTEFFRHAFLNHPAGRVSGIRYRSSLTGDPCYVVFCDNNQCVEDGEAPSDLEDADSRRLHLILEAAETTSKAV